MLGEGIQLGLDLSTLTDVIPSTRVDGLGHKLTLSFQVILESQDEDLLRRSGHVCVLQEEEEEKGEEDDNTSTDVLSSAVVVEVSLVDELVLDEQIATLLHVSIS